jgi:hypothetical protein
MGSLEMNRRFFTLTLDPPEMENPKDMFETWLRVRRSPFRCWTWNLNKDEYFVLNSD